MLQQSRNHFSRNVLRPDADPPSCVCIHLSVWFTLVRQTDLPEEKPAEYTEDGDDRCTKICDPTAPPETPSSWFNDLVAMTINVAFFFFMERVRS